MSLRRALAWALLVACSAPLLAEQPAPAAPFLWEVQGARARHYLLGSVHLLPPSSRPLPAAYDAAYAGTAALVVETDLAALTSPELQARMSELAREAQPGGLKGRVGKKLYGQVQRRAKELGIPTEDFCATWRAWFCALTLELYPLQLAQFAPEFGIDNEFFNRAREDGRPVVPLETPAFQIELFAQMPDALAREMLAATLDEKTYESQTPEVLYRMWREGDVAQLAKVVERLRRSYPKLYARLLADRTRHWAGPLAERMNQEVPTLVIVGAAHLPGPDGLLALLKARGLEPAPVTAVVETPLSRE